MIKKLFLFWSLHYRYRTHEVCYQRFYDRKVSSNSEVNNQTKRPESETEMRKCLKSTVRPVLLENHKRSKKPFEKISLIRVELFRACEIHSSVTVWMVSVQGEKESYEYVKNDWLINSLKPSTFDVQRTLPVDAWACDRYSRLTKEARSCICEDYFSMATLVLRFNRWLKLRSSWIR